MTASTEQPPTPPAGPWAVRTANHAVGFVRGMPSWLRLILGLLVVGTGVGAGYTVLERRATGRKFAAQEKSWQHFAEAVRAGDWPGMDAALVEVLDANPGDPLATSRRAALANNEADANDPAMPRLTMRKALREADTKAIRRETEKLLVYSPNDWLAHCVLANLALEAGDRATAEAEVDKLTDPGAPESGASPGVILFAFELYRRLGRDAAPLREYVQSNVARALRNELIKNLPPNDRLGVVECYLMGFKPGDVPQPPPILQAFAPARDLVAASVIDALELPDAVPVLTRAARLGPRLERAAERFARYGQITPEQLADFLADDRERTARLWGEVLARDPKSAEAYRQLTIGSSNRNERKVMLELLNRGLKECPDDPLLAELRANLLRNNGLGVEAAEQLAASARQRPNSPAWWRVAVTAARLANRGDLVLELLTESRKLRPNESWTALAEAELRLAGGDSQAAARLIEPLGVPALTTDPLATRLAANAFSASGRATQLAALTRSVEVQAVSHASPEPLTALVAGLADAAPTEEHLATTAQHAEAALRRFPGNADLLRLLAAAQVKRAELADWSHDATGHATGPTARYLAARPDDREAATWLAALRLYGEDRPEEALRDLGPVRAAEAIANAGELEVLGEALRRAGQPKEAVRVLTLASARPRPGAGVFIQLALAHHAAGDASAARAALAKAQNAPRAPREQADYAAAAKLLYRETPTP